MNIRYIITRIAEDSYERIDFNGMQTDKSFEKRGFCDYNRRDFKLLVEIADVGF